MPTSRKERAAQRERRQLHFAYLVMAFVFVLAGGFLAGRRVPYLYEGTDLIFRVPAAFAVLLSLMFAHAWYFAGGKRRKTAADSFNGMLLVAVLFAGAVFWWSGGLIAVLANTTANRPVITSYEVVGVNRSGRCSRRNYSLWYVEFRTLPDRKKVILKQCNHRKEGPPNLARGDVVCTYGRTSIFGTVIDSFTPGSCTPMREQRAL